MFFGFGLAGWCEAQFFYPYPLGEGLGEGKGVRRSPPTRCPHLTPLPEGDEVRFRPIRRLIGINDVAAFTIIAAKHCR